MKNETILWKDEEILFYIRHLEKSSTFDFLDGYIIGIKAKSKSWVNNEPLIYQAEDGFSINSKNLVKEIKQQLENKKSAQIIIEDAEMDTDANIIFDCEPNVVSVSGNLGNTIDGNLQLSFKFDATPQILTNLYNFITANSKV